MNKVLHLCLNSFLSGSRVLKESLTLSRNNYDVNIYAVHDKGLKEFEKLEKINIHRIKLKTKELPKIKIFQFFKYLEFSYYIFNKIENYNFLHIHSLSALPLAIFLKKFRNKKIKIIYDCHEYETERDNKSLLTKYLYKKMEKLLINSCDYTITVSMSIMSEYKKLYNISNIQLVYNAPFYSNYISSNIFREKFKINQDHKIYIYQGKFSRSRGVEKYIEVFKQLKDFKCCLILMGYGELVHEVQKAAEINNNIFYHNPVKLNEIQNYTSSADYGLNITNNTCLSRYYALPNKLFEYAMARIPLIVSNDYERGKFVKNKKIGFVTKDTKLKSIKEVIIKSLSYKKNYFFENLDKVANEYNWNLESKKINNIYENLN